MSAHDGHIYQIVHFDGGVFEGEEEEHKRCLEKSARLMKRNAEKRQILEERAKKKRREENLKEFKEWLSKLAENEEEDNPETVIVDMGESTPAKTPPPSPADIK